MADHILDEDVFPIVGWAGPDGEMIREQVMTGMAQAGFNVSHSQPELSTGALIRALDVAHSSGVRLLLRHPAYHVGDDFRLTKARRKEVEGIVKKVSKHPGLYGYHLRDEPHFPLLPVLAEVSHFIEGLDPYHLIYINHFPPIRGWGAATAEWFWREYVRLTHPRILSYDHYPITVGTDKDVAEGRGLPNVFADHKIVVKPDFFECLDLLRHLSNFYGIPLWAFTCSVRHGPYPTPTEGHMRFQLFNDLTYGAKGLQYFTYAHDEAMVRRDGSTTETWEIARRINGEVHNLAPVLRKLRNVEVFHNGTLWSGTRRLQRTGERLGIDVKGDQVTVGLFLGDKDLRYVMVVNANPCGWARMSIEVSVDTEKLYYVDPRDRVVRELWPPNPKSQLVCLAPGEARLFQIGGEGAGKNF